MLINVFRMIEDLGFIAQVRSSIPLYATVNALHILGLATLIGAVLTFDLRASGLWKRDRWREGLDVAIPVAATGLGLAIATGIILFAVRGSHYATMPVFLVKIAILVLGLVNIVICHGFIRRSRAALPTLGIRISAAISALIWASALFAGRWIAFAV
jgi:hypothetical protein